jgi:hypothetical protein
MKDKNTNDLETTEVEKSAAETSTIETTDSWEWKEIIKHAFFPKPEGSPKSGKKELGVRVGAGVLFVLIALMSFSGSDVPTCDDSATKDSILETVKTKVAKQFGKKADNLSYEISDIGTLKTDNRTGFQQCIANIEIIENDSKESRSTSVTYTISKSLGDNDFKVNVTKM